MSKRDIHITKRDEGWAVIREGAKRADSLHSTQQSAAERGRDLAKRDHVELVTHDRNNRIRDSDSYGRDPYPPKDKKH